MNTITAFSVGHCTHPSCMALKGSGLASRCFPSRAFLIETQAGLCLYDTGYAEHFMTSLKEGINRLYGWVTPVTFSPEQRLAGQLQALGISVDDIRTIIISHFHADHIAGLKDFPRARLVCHSAAWTSVAGKTGLAALRRAFMPTLLPSDTQDRLHFVDSQAETALPTQLLPFTAGWRLYTHDQSLFAVSLPGHARGQLGLFVETGTGWQLLAGDAAWAGEAIATRTGPSELSFLVQDNRSLYYDTLAKLHQLHTRGGAMIELSHDIRSV